MTMIKRIFMALALMLAVSTGTYAQVKFGPKIGITVDKFAFNKSTFDSDNRCGFTGGLTLEAQIPVVNLCVDVSAMYVHRTSDIKDYEHMDHNNPATKSLNRDYFEIPVNLKYKLALPLIGKMVTPYVYTGPSFAFLTGRKNIQNAFSQKRFDVAWNFGFGVELIKKLQISASYGVGMTKAVDFVSDHQAAGIEGKNKYWTVSTAYFF